MREQKHELHLMSGELFFITIWGDGDDVASVYVQEMIKDENGIEVFATSEAAKVRLETDQPGLFQRLWDESNLFDELEQERREELGLSKAFPSGSQPINTF
jgi:hypothetical protein